MKEGKVRVNWGGHIKGGKGNMKFWLKRNGFYIGIGVVCLLVMLNSVFNDSVIRTLWRCLFEPGFKTFYVTETDMAIHNLPPTTMAIMGAVLSNIFDHLYFDYQMIFGTNIFALFIPLLTIVSGIRFYVTHHSINKITMYRTSTTYRKEMIKEITKNALKIAGSIFIAYIIYLLMIRAIAGGYRLAARERTLFSDVFGVSFYQTYPGLYFILEGFIKLFIIPFSYAILTQAMVLLGKSFKEIIAIPILYYYGLAAIGYALYMIVPTIAIHINPITIMASGDYETLNSIALILCACIPLFIGVAIILKRTKYAEF